MFFKLTKKTQVENIFFLITIISNNNNRIELFENTLNQMVLKTIISDMDEKFILSK